jgi:hypothetical protein
MYIAARRDGLDFNLAYIPADFADSVPAPSGLVYMQHLYDFAYAAAKAGFSWEPVPPGLGEPDADSPALPEGN